jgi:hypothetical protein
VNEAIWDVLQLRYSEQTACFMVLLKWPIGGRSSILTKFGKSLKTVDATHPHQGGDQLGLNCVMFGRHTRWILFKRGVYWPS